MDMIRGAKFHRVNLSCEDTHTSQPQREIIFMGIASIGRALNKGAPQFELC